MAREPSARCECEDEGASRDLLSLLLVGAGLTEAEPWACSLGQPAVAGGVKYKTKVALVSRTAGQQRRCQSDNLHQYDATVPARSLDNFVTSAYMLPGN